MARGTKNSGAACWNAGMSAEMNNPSTPAPKGKETKGCDQNSFPGCIWHERILTALPVQDLCSAGRWHCQQPLTRVWGPSMSPAHATSHTQGTGPSCRHCTDTWAGCIHKMFCLPTGTREPQLSCKCSHKCPKTPPRRHRTLLIFTGDFSAYWRNCDKSKELPNLSFS